MKIPKRIKDLINRKQAFIDESRAKLERIVIKQQGQLLDVIIQNVIPKLDVKSGVIQDTPNNYRLLADVDRIFNSFAGTTGSVISSQIAGTVAEVAVFEKSYFKMILNEDLAARLDKAVKATSNLIDLRVGLKGGKTVSGGFIESIIKDKSIGLQVKDFIAKSVTGQIDQKDFIKGLSEIVTGKEGSSGAMEKQYQRYAYDLYQQYDAAYGKHIAEEFELEYFIYQGGLVSDSRDFCAAHNGKVWSTEEAQLWKEWTPSKGEYPEGYEVRQKDIYAVPSYIDYPGYDPLTDRGGYRCRHAIGYISEELAFEMRPELKVKK